MKGKKLLCGLLSFMMMLQLFTPIVFAQQNSLTTNDNTTTGTQMQNVTEGAICQSGEETPQSVTGSAINCDITTDIEQPPTDEEEYKIWKQNLIAQMNPQPRMLLSATGVSGNRVYNDYLEYAFSSIGRFTIGTTGGDPDNSNDDYKNLLYGHPSPETSKTTIRIDNNDCIFGSLPQVPITSQDGNKNTIITTVGDIQIAQIISFVKNTNTNRDDMIEIKYEIKNIGTVSHDVGTRIMLDTMLGDNDFAPFKIPGIGDCTTEMEFTGNDIPQRWQAFDDLSNPDVISTGMLYNDNSQRPDKVQFVSWPGITHTLWDYQPTPGQSIGDSAVAIYFNPKTIAPGATKCYTTYYGLDDFTAKDSRPPLSLGVFTPQVLTLNDTNTDYLPNPIAVTAHIENTSSTTATNAKINIILPSGMKIVGSNPSIVSLGDILPEGKKQITWNISIDPQPTSASLNYSIELSADNTEKKILSMSINVPAITIPPYLEGDTSKPIEVTMGQNLKFPSSISVNSDANLTKVTLGVVGYTDEYQTTGILPPSIKKYTLDNFEIYTSKSPFDKPGTYTVNIWATSSEYGSPTQPVGSLTVIVHSRQPYLEGDTSKPIEVTVGDTVQLPSNIIIHSDVNLTRVTLNVLGKTDLYKTMDFDASTKDLPLYLFGINTSEYPFNTPGTYTVNIWATSNEYSNPTQPVGSLTVIVHSRPPYLEGDTSKPIEVTIGENVQLPSNIIIHSDIDLKRVTLNVPGKTDLYKTAEFDVSTKDLPLYLFSINTTEYPFNTPGTYTVNLWATSVEYDNPTQPVGSLTVIVHSIYQTDLISPTNVKYVNPEDSIRVTLNYTDLLSIQCGSYGPYLVEGTDYTRDGNTITINKETMNKIWDEYQYSCNLVFAFKINNYTYYDTLNVDLGKKAIILLPGIMGSKLFYNDPNPTKEGLNKGEAIWNGSDELFSPNLKYIALDSSGNHPYNIVTGNIEGSDYKRIDGIPDDVTGASDNVGKLYTELKLRSNCRVIMFPYDWRDSIDDAADKLEDFINYEGLDRVYLVAHSTGGLVASSYIGKSPVNANKVGKFISLATPLLGSPLTSKATEKGEFLNSFSQPIENAVALKGSSEQIKNISKNLISTYQLLPFPLSVQIHPWLSESDRTVKLIYDIDGFHYINETETSRKYFNNYTETIEKLKSLNTWVNQKYLNKIGGIETFCSPRLMTNMYDINTHAANQKNTYLIAGYGMQGTFDVDYANVKDQNGQVIAQNDYLREYDDKGDGAVPLFSATLGYIGLNQQPNNITEDHLFFIKAEHGAIPNNPDVITLVLQILRNEKNINVNNILTYDVLKTKEQKYIKTIAACPVEMWIYDENDQLVQTVKNGDMDVSNKYGYFYTQGFNGEEKVAILYNDKYRVELLGTGQGTMDYSIEQISENMVEEGYKTYTSVKYKDLEVKKGSIFKSNLFEPKRIEIDVNGDNIIDNVISPNEEINSNTSDRVVPIITVSDYNKNSTNKDITITASTNEGTLNTTSHTFMENGSFEFVATDEAGNITRQTVTLTNIDKVAPVITIGVYTKTPTNQDMVVTATTNEGTLNTSSHTFTENGSFDFIATDLAGNVTTKTITITNINKNPGGPSVPSGGVSGGSNPADGNNALLPKIRGSETVGWTSIINSLKESKNGDIVIDMNGSTVVPKDVFETIKGKDVEVAFVLGNDIEWSVKGKDISENTKLQDIDFNLSLNTNNIPSEVVDKLPEFYKIQFSFANDGNFEITAKLRIPLKEDKRGQRANLYYYNPVTKQLALQSTSIITESSNVEFEFTHASDYLILISDERLIKDELAKIEVTPTSKILYYSGTTDTNMTIKTVLPKSLQDSVSSGINQMSMKYYSSDPTVAYVSNTGEVVAKKSGIAVIYSIVNVNGIEKRFRTVITVKKAYIKMTMRTSSMKVGENITFKAIGYGVDTKDITYSTTKKSIVTISKTTGKAVAVSAGTDYVVAKVGAIVVKVKVKVK